ncbi:MAG: hypothetical protein IJ941_03215 [Clostridia bacterium]|nr:hypothetical protein [Clostridia bacterium]
MEKDKIKGYKKTDKKRYEKTNPPVKIYEIDIILSEDGKSYKAYVPAYTTQGVLNGLTHIVDYMRKYRKIHFDVCTEPVV